MPVSDPTTYTQADIVAVDLARMKWHAIGAVEEGGDSRSRLIAVLQIGGADFHASAIEVTNQAGEQSGAIGVEDAFDQLDEFSGGEGAFDTVSIEGRRYALFATPFREG